VDVHYIRLGDILVYFITVGSEWRKFYAGADMGGTDRSRCGSGTLADGFLLQLSSADLFFVMTSL
jgi:hypothetical protein